MVQTNATQSHSIEKHKPGAGADDPPERGVEIVQNEETQTSATQSHNIEKHKPGAAADDPPERGVDIFKNQLSSKVDT
jgi:hypothetical protein